MKESSLVLYNDWLLDYAFGSESSVEFDFEKIWKFKTDMAEYFDPTDLLFVYVHPAKSGTELSEIDKNCFKKLNITFDSPIWLAIICFHNSNIYDLHLDGCLYYCHDGIAEPDDSFPNCTPDVTDAHLALLKVLACSELITQNPDFISLKNCIIHSFVKATILAENCTLDVQKKVPIVFNFDLLSSENVIGDASNIRIQDDKIYCDMQINMKRLSELADVKKKYCPSIGLETNDPRENVLYEKLTEKPIEKCKIILVGLIEQDEYSITPALDLRNEFFL